MTSLCPIKLKLGIYTPSGPLMTFPKFQGAGPIGRGSLKNPILSLSFKIVVFAEGKSILSILVLKEPH